MWHVACGQYACCCPVATLVLAAGSCTVAVVIVVVGGDTVHVPTTNKYQEAVQDPSSSVRRPLGLCQNFWHILFFCGNTLFLDNQPCSAWDIVYQIGFPSV